MLQEKYYYIGAHKYIAPKLETALYLVSTPIGNLKDITLRALETLTGVDYIACEDTRVSRVLLDNYAIKTKLIPYHEYSSETTITHILSLINSGNSVALISDAGTPLISDPGFKLVQQAYKANLKVMPIVGASALLGALVVSGMASDNFTFIGFLPNKKQSRQKKILEIANSPITHICYESPHRLLETLSDLKQIMGAEREISISRELTKKFETISRGTVQELYDFYIKKTSVKGEIVLIISPKKDTSWDINQIDELLLEYFEHNSLSRAASEVAKITGHKKHDLYQRLLSLKDNKN